MRITSGRLLFLNLVLVLLFPGKLIAQQFITSPADNSSYLFSVVSVPLTATRADGTFSGPGVTDLGNGSGTFSPGVAGVGAHQIHYSKSGGGSYDCFITVNVVPSITFNPSLTQFCESGNNFGIDGYSGAPAGGVFTFSGTGVVGTTFYPAVAGSGLHVITARYTLNGVFREATAVFDVRESPSLELFNYHDNHCQYDPDYVIRVRNSVTFEFITSGSFTGKGITDYSDGTALFSPSTAGLGYHSITYTYTDVNSCNVVINEIARVGTELFIEDLPATFCLDDPADNFTYSPVDLVPPVPAINEITGPGVTDNHDGTAIFDPSAAGVGVHTITYTFEDPIDAFLTCINVITRNVTVYSVPITNFSGLNATREYCSGSPDVLLTGNYAPSGVFTGDGITDHGNGTATFRPSSLGTGTYSITYSYTNGNGCTDTFTRDDIKILPVPVTFNVTGGGTRCISGLGVPVGLSGSTTGIDYILYRDGVAVSPENRQPGLTGNPVSFGDMTAAGTYTVMAVNPLSGCSSVMAGNAVIAVNQEVAITTHPSNAVICENGAVSFSVQATGQNLHYQWYNDGVATGIDNNIIVLNPVNIAEDGSEIYCVVTSSCGGPVTSNKAVLTVNPNNRVITNPVSALKCAESNVSFSVQATGLNTTYQWKKGAVDISDIPGKIAGSNSPVLTINDLQPADAGLYSCTISGDCGGPVSSTQATLTVNEAVVITAQPVSVTACTGDNVSFSASATPLSGLNYQWYFDPEGGAVAFAAFGAPGKSLPITGVAPANEGDYYCMISNACGEVQITNTVTLNIPAQTAITLNPAGDVVCAGSNLNLSVTATGENLTYQWFRDADPALTDNAVVHNSTTANISFTGLTTAYTGNYRVKVTGTCGEVTSSPDAVISVRQPISITSQPVNRTICAGSDVTFSVVATGDDLTYQWQYNNVNIPSADDPDYTITGATAINAGAYRCIVSSSECGSLASTSATLTVNPLTAITTQPVPAKNACIGTNVSFSVVATGIGLTYQWHKNGVSMAGYTAATLNLVNVDASSAGSYTCYVTGSCGPVQISSPGVLTIDIPPVISDHPVSASVCLGSTQELNVVLSAGTNSSYQWYFDNDLDGAFIPVPGATSQILSINPFDAATAGDYYCRITNGCGSVNSQTARLTLIDVFNITAPLTDINVCENGSATLTVAADQPVFYEWQKNGVVIPGQTSSSLILNNIPFADNGAIYSCRIYNNCITKITSSTITVSRPAGITQQPQSGIACPGSPYSIVVVASGTNPTYQWYESLAGMIPGATGPALSFTPFVAGDAGTYYCVVTNGCGPVTSANAVITSGTTTSVTNPLPLSLCAGDDAVFTVATAGDNLVYEWRKNYIPLVDDGRIIGSGTGTLTIKDITAADEETYDIIVTGTCGVPATSAGAFLEVTTPPVIITNPVPQTICSGDNASFSVTTAPTVSDPPNNYQWQLNDVPIPLATSSTLSGVVAPGIYNCVVSNSCGSVTSTSAELIIEQNVSIINHPAPSQIKCEGSNVTFTVDIDGPTDMTLQWYKDDGTPAGTALANGGKISGVNLATLTINNLTAADAGSYFCRATGSCGTRTTNSGALVIQERVTVTQHPQSITICPGGTLTLNTIASGSITTYKWKYFNGVATVDVGTNDPVYSVSPFNAAAHAGTYTCEMTNVCETVVTNAAFVTAGVPTSATISADITECEGANASFTVSATGSNLTYRWYHGAVLLTDNTRIGGSSTSTLTISGLIPADDGTYQCEVSGSCGFDNDNAAVLTVRRNISFDVQPVSTSALVGTNATFTVVASGNITGYQWYKGATPLADLAGEISGATTPVLSVLNAQPVTDEGSYSVVVQGACGNRTSNSAALTVIPTSVITVQPVTPVIVCEGATISLSVTTSGSGHTYQWKRDATTLITGGRISGATTASLTISGAVAGDAGAYICVVDGSEISSASVVTVNPLTVITSHPAGGTKCAGDAHIFSVTATGAGLTYQWYRNDLATPVAGALSSEYTIMPVSVADNGTYFCVVTGTCGPRTSNPATLIVNNPVSITGQPAAITTICEGSSTSLSFNVTGTNLAYLWKKNGQPITDPNITGITTGTLVIPGSVVTNTGIYSCTVTGACSAQVTSNNAVVTVNPVTAITLQPSGRTTCEGDAVTFTVAAAGSNLTYDWMRNGVSLGLPAPGNPSLVLTALNKATHEGVYTCLVTGACGTPVTSEPAVLTVNRVTSIGIPVVSDNPICQDASTRITITAAGDGLTYLWKKNGQSISAANITGVTTNELVISNAQPGDAGSYTCTVTGLCGSPLTSTSAVITVNPTTVITTQPLGYTKCAGDEVIFDVVASGDITSYQWRQGAVDLTDIALPSGAVVTGSGTPQLRITNLTTAEAASYTCVITGTCGNVISTPAVLTINIPAQITAEPPSLTELCQGSSTSLNVTTTGTITSYRWKKDGNYIANGGSYSGVTTASLVISNAILSDAGIYSCEIVSNCNSLNTQSAELRVNPLTAITLQPSGATLCEGENVQFMVNATGGLPLNYQWRFNNVPVPGATTNTLIINGINSSNAGAYTCYITSASGCGAAVSAPANLTVNSGATIDTQPLNTAVCQGSTAIISVAASGTAPLTYRWKYNDVYMSDGGRITGSTTSELRISGSIDADEGIYKCEVTSPCGIVESSSVTLTVDPATSITIHPANQYIVQGTTAVFSVAANGIITGYQWQKDGSPLADGGDITGATTAILRIANVAVADAGSYRCVVTGKCGILTSNPGTLTVNVPVAITVSPVDIDRCAGGSASFNVAATGSIVSYRWMFNGAAIADGGTISGAATPNLVISSVTAANEGNYACVVTGTFNTANSSTAVLTVNEPAHLTVQPLSQTLCIHDWLVLEVNATGENLNYSWEKNGIPLAADASTTGINSSLLVITDVDAARSGSYRCRVWNTCNTELSNAAVITINPPMTLISSPVNDTKCQGQTASFSVTASGTGIQYQWYKGGVILNNSTRITGAQSGNLTITSLQVSDQDSYSCSITDNCNTINSVAATLTVKERVIITGQPENMVVCENQNAYFEVRASGFNLSYQWQKDGVNIDDVAGHISGTNSSVLVITNAAFGDRGVYRCQVTGDCNTILTNTANLTVNLLPAPAGAVTGSTLICQGATRVLYVVPAIANASSYVWTIPYGAVITGGTGTRSIEVSYPVGSISGIVSVHGVNDCADGAESPALPVTVNPIPLADAGPDQILCADNTTLAADATGYVPGSGIWTKLSGQGNITNPDMPNSGLTDIGQGENIFMWTVTLSGCISRDTVTISNKIVPVDAGTDQTICSMTTTLSANTPSIGTGSWSIVSGGAVFSNNTDPDATISNLSRGLNILQWSISNSGCISSDIVNVRNDLPSNALAGEDTIILSDNYILDGNVPVIGTGQWTLVKGSAIITNPAQYNTPVTGLGIGENIFRWTITNNLCYSHDEVKVINYTPTVTDAGPNQTLCSDRTFLAGTRPTYGTGQWSVVAGSATFIDPGRFDSEVINIGKGQNIYRWTIFEYLTTYDDVIITNNSPTGANAGIDQRLCGTDAVLNANTPLIGTGTWTVIGGSGNIADVSDNRSPVSNLGSGSNTFRWTITNGACISFDEVQITNDQPTLAEAGTDQVICADSVTLYPNTPTIGTGEWSVVQGSAFFIGNKAYNLARGENHLKWTISHNGCTHSDIVIITCNKPTTAYTGNDRSICVDSINLPGNSPTYGTGQWSVLSGSGIIEDPYNPNSMVRNLASGQNRFRWTITFNNCVSFSDVNINYNYIQADAGPDQVLCQSGAMLTANDPAIGTGQWSIVGGSGSVSFVNPEQSNTEVLNLDRGANVLRWTIVNSGCVSSDEVIISNNLPSEAYAGSDRSVCGEEIFLNANTPLVGTGHWSILSGAANIEDPALSSTLISNMSIGRNVLRWTITNQDCILSDEVTIYNNQPTGIEAGPNQYICADSAQLYATAPVSGYGRWSILKGSATFEDNTLYNTRVSNLEKGENKLIWTVTIAGCSNYDSVTVVNNLPATPSAGPDQDICADNVFMAANSPLIGDGKWSIVSGSAEFENTTSPGTRVSHLGNGDNILRWSITNGSCILYDEVTITNSLPTVAYAGEDRAICNTEANLLATAPVSGTGSWSVVSGYGLFSDPNAHDAQIRNLGFGSNTLRWTTTNGNCMTSDDVIITNNLADVYAGPDQIVYSPDTRLIGNKPSSGEGLWIVTAGNGTIGASNNFETSITNLGGGANTFTWTINNEGCIASDDVVVTYRMLPVADFDPMPGGGCVPVTVSFINTSIGGTPYTWDFGDGTTSSSTNATHTYNVPGNYRVRLTATGPDGIMIYKDTTVVIREIPVAAMAIDPDTAYIPGNSVHFHNLSNNIDSLMWDFGDGNTSTEENPSYKYGAEGSYDVTLHVWSGYECYDSIIIRNAVTVERAGIIKCPNAFTPNPNGSSGGYYNDNDFSNDVFHCYIEGAKAYHMEVYNRIGIRIFETNDINVGWDGYFKGELVEEGAYIFRATGKFNNGETFSYFGNILVIY